LQGNASHFQNPQHPHHSQNPQHLGALQGCQVHDHQVGGQDGNQINQAPKTEEIFHAVFGEVQIAQVIDGEKQHREIFNAFEEGGMLGGVGLHRFASQGQTRNQNGEIDDAHPTLKDVGGGVGEHLFKKPLIRRMCVDRTVHGKSSFVEIDKNN
jgi:hypothetical protein